MFRLGFNQCRIAEGLLVDRGWWGRGGGVEKLLIEFTETLQVVVFTICGGRFRGACRFYFVRYPGTRHLHLVIVVLGPAADGAAPDETGNLPHRWALSSVHALLVGLELYYVAFLVLQSHGCERRPVSSREDVPCFSKTLGQFPNTEIRVECFYTRPLFQAVEHKRRPVCVGGGVHACKENMLSVLCMYAHKAIYVHTPIVKVRVYFACVPATKVHSFIVYTRSKHLAQQMYLCRSLLVVLYAL